MKVEQDFEVLFNWLTTNVGPMVEDNWVSISGDGWVLSAGTDYNPKGNFIKDYWEVTISDRKKEIIFALTFC